MGFRLRIVEGRGTGKDFFFSLPKVKIGRAEDNDLVLYDSGVSRYHSEILIQDGEFTLQDLGSANGTLHNGARANAAQLKASDRLQVGPVVFVFEPCMPPEAPAGRPIDKAHRSSPNNRAEMFRPQRNLERQALERDSTLAYPSSPLTDEQKSKNLNNKNRTLTGSFRGVVKNKLMGSFNKLPKTIRLTVLLVVILSHIIFALATYSYIRQTHPDSDQPTVSKSAGVEPNMVRAQELYELGQKAYNSRTQTPANLYRAIEYFETATTYLTQGQSESGLSAEINGRTQMARQELLALFDSHVQASYAALRAGNRDKAIEVLRSLLLFIPNSQDPRHKKAQSLLTDLSEANKP